MDFASPTPSAPSEIPELTSEDYLSLGAFRYQIRKFLHFSELAVRAEGLEPQQHQLLLAVKTMEAEGGPTVGTLAEHLLIRHHSAVGLLDRLEERGLVKRARADGDRRQVRIALTPRGASLLTRLSAAHRDELRHTGPLLVQALEALLAGPLGRLDV